MRGNIALVPLVAAGLLVSGSAATSKATTTATQPALPEQVTRGVIVDLSDGDRFKATVSRDQRTVWGSRYDAATRSWTDRSVVLRKNGLYCGDVDARGAGTAVALIAECDYGGYSEDTAPADSHALYSPDTIGWTSYRLPGEAYDEPGISPNGAHAVWPLHGRWVTFTAAGFRLVQRDLPDQEYTTTATISDSGDVSVLYGGRGEAAECTVNVLTVAASGAEARQRLAVDNACGDLNMANVDANTVLFGEFQFPESVTTITRPDTSSPWAVTGTAPAEAPGLVSAQGRGSLRTKFVHSRGLPLTAVGSSDRRSFTAQTYDSVAQRWGEPVPILEAAERCRWADTWLDEPLSVLVLQVECGQKRYLLASADALAWHDVRLGRTPLGVSADRRYVAASSKARTLILSRERGLVRLPVGTRARCDVVSPVSPDRAVRVSSTRGSRGWPSVLHESTATGWRRTDTRFPPPRMGQDRCRLAEVAAYEEPVSYRFRSGMRGISLSVVPDGASWRIRNVRQWAL